MSCYSCGQPGHYANVCPTKPIKYRVRCRRCGKVGHYSPQCPSRPKISRRFLKPSASEPPLEETCTIYVLRLQGGNYYIGRTRDSDARIQAHFEGKGSYWTKKYPPVKVIERVEKCDEFDEDKYVKKYMAKHGIDRVRGGSYSQITLDRSVKKYLQKEIWGAQDKCFRCGGDHFDKECPGIPVGWWDTLKSWFWTKIDEFDKIRVKE